MTKTFRIIGAFEALSLLVLFFFAMPMKYIWGDPSWVRLVGMIHGLLFITYMSVAVALTGEENWPKKYLLYSLLLASVPFGTFIFEKKFHSRVSTNR